MTADSARETIAGSQVDAAAGDTRPHWLAVATSIGLEADIFSGQAALAMLAIPEEADLRIDLDRCVEI
jgi:hypothetical protein